MNKLFSQFCSMFDYKTYNNIKKGLIASCGGTFMLDMIMAANGIQGTYILGLMTDLLLLSYAYLKLSNGENYTKDISEIKNLYQEFICNYNKMNKVFGFSEPISIYVMFNYLVYSGYLSKNMNFEFKNYTDEEIFPIMGASVINGIGVCRHISSMLTDILNDCNISSANVDCFAMPAFSEEIVRRSEIRKLTANHLITYALYDGKSYYLDPTLARIYRLKDGKTGTIYDGRDNRVLIMNQAFKKFNSSNNPEIYKLRNNVLSFCESVSLEEEKRIVALTLDICENNMDIFEGFYNDNRELYDEISSKLVRVRKKQSI